MIHLTMEAGAAEVVSRLLHAGYDAYVVGGCVRDALLGHEANDWDVCTSALPEETIALFGEDNCIPTGLKHGTVTVKMLGGLYEVTTFRTESAYSDGRHPDRVDFVCDVREDLSRRDFTINAMAYNDRAGLVDPFGGREDLFEHRIVRAVGEPMKRFDEDALRIMRLFRFASRFGFAIEEETLRAAVALRSKLPCVSGERIREELMKLLETNAPSAYLPKAVLDVILPGMEPVGEEAYARVLCAVDALSPDSELRLAALLSPLGDAPAAMKPLRCSNKTTQRVLGALEGAKAEYEESDAALCIRARRMLGSEGLNAIEDMERLSQVICSKDAAKRIQRLLWHAQEAHTRGLCVSIRQLQVNGGDLLRLTDGNGGKRIGQALEHLLSAVLREEIPNEKEALLCAARAYLSEERETT